MIKLKPLAGFILFLFLIGTVHAQNVTVSGLVKDQKDNSALPFASIILEKASDSSFVSGTYTDEQGRFTLLNVREGSYKLRIRYAGYKTLLNEILVGHLTNYLDLKTLYLQEDLNSLKEVEVSAKKDEVDSRMDRKTFNVDENTSQKGGSVLQAMKNLPGITIDAEGGILLRGSDKIVILIDGQLTVITAKDLDNLPASAIESIEVINNPSSKYDANGNAGLINIVYKKSGKQGFNGKAGLTAGLGALWVKKENLPGIRPQYQFTPKINPSLILNYKKKKLNVFLQGDYLYTETLNKNEFVDRIYDDGTQVKQQSKRNRNTAYSTVKAGFDWNIDKMNSFSFSGYFNDETIIDNGDEPFFNGDLSERTRLWTYLEDEVKTTVIASAVFKHKYVVPGKLLNLSFNYTFHREDEKYFFTNTMPTFVGEDSFKLLSDENVADFNLDYTEPLRHGRFETGFKFRKRFIPTNMQFFPGLNSPLDTNAGGKATYSENIPALYGNYVYESKKYEVEAGLRVEYVNLEYDVNENHNTYKSDGYNYTQPFPNLRLAMKLNDKNRVSLFYNRRVDRPNEIDIRIFPKYDDAEILKVGNPAINPQFTNTVELGYKSSVKNGYVYAALYHRMSDGTITRVASSLPGRTLVYSIMQNAGKSSNSGLELVFSKRLLRKFSFNVNANLYQNTIDAFTVNNLYPEAHSFKVDKQELFSWNAKFNGNLNLSRSLDIQITAIYLAKDLIPQGTIGERYSIDLGVKKLFSKRSGELFLNASDIFNTMQVRKEINGNGVKLTATDYYETQVIRLGYSFKF